MAPEPQYSDEVQVTLTVIDPVSNEERFFKRTFLMNKHHVEVEFGRVTKRDERLSAGPDNGWFHSPTMSRDHAKLMFSQKDNAVAVMDLGSLHGTYVNSEPVGAHVWRKLVSNDILRFGVTIERQEEIFRACELRVELKYGLLSPDQRPAVFRVPDSTDEEDETSEIDETLGTSIAILQKAGVAPARKVGPVCAGTIDLTGDDPVQKDHGLQANKKSKVLFNDGEDHSRSLTFLINRVGDGDSEDQEEEEDDDYEYEADEVDDEDEDEDEDELEDEDEDEDTDEDFEETPSQQRASELECLDSSPKHIVNDENVPLTMNSAADFDQRNAEKAKRADQLLSPTKEHLHMESKRGGAERDNGNHDNLPKSPPSGGAGVSGRDLPAVQENYLSWVPAASFPLPRVPILKPVIRETHGLPQGLGVDAVRTDHSVAREQNRPAMRPEVIKAFEALRRMTRVADPNEAPYMLPNHPDTISHAKAKNCCTTTADLLASGREFLGTASLDLPSISTDPLQLPSYSNIDDTSAFAFEKSKQAARLAAASAEPICTQNCAKEIDGVVGAAGDAHLFSEQSWGRNIAEDVNRMSFGDNQLGSGQPRPQNIAEEVVGPAAVPCNTQPQSERPSCKRKSDEISTLLSEEAKIGTCEPKPKSVEPSVELAYTSIAPGEVSTALSPIGARSQRPVKRLRRVAEAFGYAALGGVAVMSALIATAPEL